MADPFLGEIRLMSFNFAPKGWALANGQLLPINQNQALFALFGTTYGGDGRVNFALPNIQGRVPMHVGGGFTLGQRGGEEAHTITQQETPTHNHLVNVTSAAANLGPNQNFFAQANQVYQAPAPNTNLASNSITNTGGSQAHNNMQPYLAITFAVALQGIFPSPT